MVSKAWIGVHTGSFHCLDHLGVLCEGLNMPLFVTEVATYEAALQFYPRLEVHLLEPLQLSLDFFATQADVIFVTSYHFASQVKPLIQALYRKNIRFVYCPHGNSDKQEIAQQDLALIYGSHMLDQLKRHKELNRIKASVISGNYRLMAYQSHASEDDLLLKQFLEKPLSDHPLILYAPTWPKRESLDAFMHTAEKVLCEIGSSYPLWVKWHPLFEEYYPVHAQKLKRVGETFSLIQDVSSFPLIYPLLQAADIYIGDFSSIGYDFLTLNKPLFLTHAQETEISQCAPSLPHTFHWKEVLASFQDTAILKEKRGRLADRVFGGMRSFEEIKQDLEETLKNSSELLK
ncbi:MAG: CDP-glycerol glycerophosphotransferase family protein [Candidatus Rhabdochlamydia sp.]